MMHSTTVTVGSQRWHLRQTGSGPSVLLLHGAGADGSSWEPLAPQLAPHYSLIAPDLPGHGGSSPAPAAAMKLPALLDSLVALLSALPLQPAAIIGHSAGAAIALALAAGHRAGGARVVGIAPALREPPAAAAAPARWLARHLAGSDTALALLARLGRLPLTARLILTQARATTTPDRAERYTALISQPSHLHAALTLMAEWRLDILEQSLGAITAPVLLLSGQRDPWYPPKVVQTFTDRIPTARCLTIAAAGHLPHEERPDQCAEAILAFLAS